MDRIRFTIVSIVLGIFSGSAGANITPIELTPGDVGSSNSSYFIPAPTNDPATFLGTNYGSAVRTVDFNTAPDGSLSEGGSVNNQYASLGVTMNDIRITTGIFGGNNYGSGFATEDNAAQVFTFTTPAIAVGIVNTSPDNDLIRFYAGPDATGDLLFSFRDQEGMPRNFDVDRFVGGVADPGVTIGSFSVSNQQGDLELDELVFAIPEPGAGALMAIAGLTLITRRRHPTR